MAQSNGLAVGPCAASAEAEGAATAPRAARRMSALPADPVVGMGIGASLVLLAVLAVTVGLGVPGWAAGVVTGVGAGVLLRSAVRRSGRSVVGPADVVTLGRAVLVSGVTALAVEALRGPVAGWLLVVLTVTALALDGVDGQVARRTGTASAVGARFDMEVDAYLILVLSVYQVRPLGAWVIAIGLMRYGFVLAGRAMPWLLGALPPLFSRKVVAAVQGVALVVTATGLLPHALALATAGTALVLLCWSFGRDVLWLHGAHAAQRPAVSLVLRARPERRLAA